MAQIEVMTAARMLQIEAEAVVDGEVVGDNLVLTRRDGVQINAGDVRGPQGIQGPEGPTAAQTSLATPNTIAKRDADGRLRIATPADVSDASTKGYVDGLITGVNNLVLGVELDGATDLNSLKTTGRYFQSHNAEATTAKNYPDVKSGVLEVHSNTDSVEGQVWQTYIPHGDLGGVVYRRVYYLVNNTWYPWKKYMAEDDTGWIAAATAGFTASAVSLTGGTVRRRNGMVAIQLTGAIAAAQSAGNIANINMWNIPSGWVPSQSNGTFDAGASGSSYTAYASAGGTIVMSNNTIAKAAGETVQAMGSYML